MATMLHPIRALRDSLQQIGAAISASREFTRAGDRLADCRAKADASCGIPF